jgi:hypothetical protein
MYRDRVTRSRRNKTSRNVRGAATLDCRARYTLKMNDYNGRRIAVWVFKGMLLFVIAATVLLIVAVMLPIDGHH